MAWCHQAITWANVDPDLCRHMVSLSHNELTHLSMDKMAVILEVTFWNSFSWMKMFEFQVKFHLGLLTSPIEDKWALVQVMACHPLGTKPLPLFSLAEARQISDAMCITRPQGVNNPLLILCVSGSIQDPNFFQSFWNFQKRYCFHMKKLGTGLVAPTVKPLI